MLAEGSIKLRPLQKKDKAPLALLLNNKKICDNLRDLIPFPYTEKDAVFFINTMKDGDPVTVFGIECNGEFCGVISIIPQNDVYSKSAETGYWLGEPFWNKGITTTAVRLITEYSFQQLGFMRLFAGVFEYNPASMKVLEKNGYKKEGVFEKSIFKNGRLWDEHRYAKLK
jgi:ribosomal-protein-alanine N-acetyltransferase